MLFLYGFLLYYIRYLFVCSVLYLFVRTFVISCWLYLFMYFVIFFRSLCMYFFRSSCIPPLWFLDVCLDVFL